VAANRYDFIRAGDRTIASICRDSLAVDAVRFGGYLAMRRIAPILALIALLAAYHTAGVVWGRDAKLYALIGMLVLYALLTLALSVVRHRLRREHPELAAELDADKGAPWYWRFLDGVLGVSFAFGPPLIVSLARCHPLSWEGTFTGYHLLSMTGGIGLYLLCRAYVIRRYQHRHGVANDAAE
jgi:hypothetical protein